MHLITAEGNIWTYAAAAINYIQLRGWRISQTIKDWIFCAMLA